MDDAGENTVSRLIEILAGRAPLAKAQEIVSVDVASHMDGFTFRGIHTWAKWLSYVRAQSRVGPPDLVTDRIAVNEDGTVTAYGRWKGRKDGETVLSTEIWARYRVVNGKIAEIWTHRGNYVFLLGPIIGSSAGLIVVMLQVYFWSRTVGKVDLYPESGSSLESR